MDEVLVKTVGRRFCLWWAVDQHGVLLEKIPQRKRDTRAARRLLAKLMKRQDFVPRCIA
nr:DDE-type integrase/transposase/recombinase [Paracoccus aestuariivivens]